MKNLIFALFILTTGMDLRAQSADTICSNFSVSHTLNNESFAGACDGIINSYTHGGNGHVSYSWNNGLPTSRIDSLCKGTYVLTATDKAGCISHDTVTVGTDHICKGFNLDRVTTTDETAQGCEGTAIPMVSNANGALTYSWSNGSTASSLNNLCSGTYSLYVSDTASCTDSIDFYILPDTICSEFYISHAVTDETVVGGCDASINSHVYGGNGAVSYSWSNGFLTSKIDSLCAGTYTLIATDTEGCIAEKTIVLGSDTTIADTVKTSIMDTTYITIRDTVTVIKTVVDTVIKNITVQDTLNIYLSNIITSVNDASQAATTVKVFPNPAAQSLTVEIDNYANLSGVTIKVFDALSTEVHNEAVTSSTQSIYVSGWSAGLYFIHVINGASTIDIRKIVVEN